MPPVKILARSLLIELNTGTDALPVWTPIGGVNSLTFDSDKTDVDETDFDSDGWAEHSVAQRGRKIALQGFYKEDPATGDQDPGQEALIALSDAVGPDSLKPLRITTPGGNTTVYQVSADAKNTGGGLNDDAGFACDLAVSGKPVFTPAA
jgi:hypothetical protein